MAGYYEDNYGSRPASAAASTASTVNSSAGSQSGVNRTLTPRARWEARVMKVED
jgi:hypothetical protein